MSDDIMGCYWTRVSWDETRIMFPWSSSLYIWILNCKKKPKMKIQNKLTKSSRGNIRGYKNVGLPSSKSYIWKRVFYFNYTYSISLPITRCWPMVATRGGKSASACRNVMKMIQVLPNVRKNEFLQ